MKKCTTCSFDNFPSELFCKQCQEPLWNPALMMRKLWEKQKQLEERHDRERKALRRELQLLDLSLAKEITPEPTVPVSFEEKRQAVAHAQPAPVPVPKPSPVPVPQAVQQEKAAPVEDAPSFGEWLRTLEWLEPFFAGADLVGGIYSRYKKEGKLPIFFMTLFGMAALLFGTGYLMQYSLQYMGAYAELVKIAGGFALVGVLLFFGIRLYGKEEKYSEYASALISLSLVLNYLMIYFLTDLGNFPMLSSSLTGFLLIVANTGLAVFLALKYETRVVAVIFLVGGALTPFYLDASGDGTLYYLYLWLLTAGAVTVAYRIKWKGLFYLSFVTAYALIEGLVFGVNPSSNLFTVYYHLFAYLFFFCILWEKGKWKSQLAKLDIVMLAGNLSFLFFNLFSIYENDMRLLGGIYLVNATLFTGFLFKSWAKFSAHLKLTLTIVIAAFVGLAIPALFEQALMGLFWSVEAVLLIVLGFLYRMPLVRKEGYLVLALAAGKLLFHSTDLLTQWGDTIFHEGFMNYMVLGAVISGLWVLSMRFKPLFTAFENNLFSIVKELVPLWAASVWFALTYQWLEIWSLNLAVVPMYGLILWQKKFDTQLTAAAGLMHLLVLFGSYALSAQEAGSWRFSFQTLPAQIAMIEWMASIWLLKKYFETLKMESSGVFEITYYLRILFYTLLPLILVNYVRRNAIEFIEPALWAGILFTYFLHRKFRYKALLFEAYGLTALAVYLTFVWNSPEGYASAVLGLVAIYFLEKMHSEKSLEASPYVWLMTPAPYLVSVYLTAFLMIFIGDSHQWNEAPGLFAFFLLVFVYFKDKLPLVARSQSFGLWLFIFVNAVNMFSLFVVYQLFPVYFIALVNWTGFAWLLFNRKQWFDTRIHRRTWNMALVVHQLITLAFYLAVLNVLDVELSGPLTSLLLVVHAIALIFINLRSGALIFARLSAVLFGIAILKVALHDISDFTMLYKVLVFMALGVLLLSASYAYVRLIKPKK